MKTSLRGNSEFLTRESGAENRTLLEICCQPAARPETVLRTVETLLLGAKPTDRCLDDLKKKGAYYLEAIAILEQAVLNTETLEAKTRKRNWTL